MLLSASAEEGKSQTSTTVPVSITVLTPPERTEYEAFDSFTSDGLTVRVDYSTGEWEEITADELGIEYLTDSDRLRYGDGGVYITYLDFRLLLPLEVKKREYDVSGVSFSSLKSTYNGEWQGIELTQELPVGLDGIPLMASISGGGRDVGVYSLSLTFSTESRDYRVPEPQNARLEIRPYRLEVEWQGREFVYDGTPKLPRAFARNERGETVELLVQGEGVYASDFYVAHAASPSDNYLLSESLCPYKILKADYDVGRILWSTGSFVYDGGEKSVFITGLPEGVSLLEYRGNVATGAGKYTAEAVVSYDVRNYNPPNIPAFFWEIERASYDMSGAFWEGLSAVYDGAEHRARLLGLPDGVTVKEYVGCSATEAGSYRLSCVFDYDKENYNAPKAPDATLVIAKKSVSVPRPSRVIYDGEMHEIDISAEEYYQETRTFVKSIGKYTVKLVLRDPENYVFTTGGDTATVEVRCRLGTSAVRMLVVIICLAVLLLVFLFTAIALRIERLHRVAAAIRCLVTAPEEPKLQTPLGRERRALLPETALLSVDSERADSLISDSLARSLLAREDDPILTDGRRKCIVNVDTLSEHFASGERVDVNVLKERGIVPPDTAYIKVLARGVIDKPLRVLANDFSPAAIKMIALTGGEAKRVVTLRKKDNKKKQTT